MAQSPTGNLTHITGEWSPLQNAFLHFGADERTYLYLDSARKNTVQGVKKPAGMDTLLRQASPTLPIRYLLVFWLLF
jgi:hypothetical protein